MNYANMFNLNGKVCVVTGGARGIGKSIALAMAHSGARVILADLLRDEAHETSEYIRSLGYECDAVFVDVCSYDSVEKMVDEVMRISGSLDILVNNAGVHYKSLVKGGDFCMPLSLVDDENWDRVFNTNVKGIFHCVKAVENVMEMQHSGAIINIASMSAFIGNMGRSNTGYAASKSAVVGLTRQLGAEWAEKGIRINGIAPGYTRTDMGSKALGDTSVSDFIAVKTPMRREGTPEDIGGVAVFLASEASRYIVGQTLLVDGGFTLW